MSALHLFHDPSNSVTPLPTRLFALLSLAALTLAMPALGAGACLLDPYAIPLSAGESWSASVGDTARSSACFVVDVPQSGLLAVELTQPSDAPRAFLSLTGSSTDDESDLEIARRGVGVLVIEARPGRYGVRVASARGRTPFRLTTRFAPRLAGKGEHDSELEIEPEGFAGCGFDKGEHDSELEIEPEGFSAPPPPSADLAVLPWSRDVRQALCSRPDGLLCAGRLSWNTAVRGDVASVRLNEARVYRFAVREVAPVAIRAQVARHGGDLTLELLDRSGLRLGAWATRGGASDRVSILNTVLVPGTYFVRLQSRDGARVDYELTLSE